MSNSRRTGCLPPPGALPLRTAREPSASCPWCSSHPPNQVSLMGWSKKECSAAAGLSLSSRHRRGKCFNGFGHFCKAVRIQGVVHPAAFPPVGYQPSILQDLEVEGQPRLRCVERAGKVTDAALSETEPLQDGKPGTVRQSMEQARGTGNIWADAGSHVPNVSMFVDMSSSLGLLGPFGGRTSRGR